MRTSETIVTLHCSRCDKEEKGPEHETGQGWMAVAWERNQTKVYMGTIGTHHPQVDLCDNCYIDFTTFMQRCKV